MFQWYKAAQLCIVHLEDVADNNDLESFEKSNWFTRGWTLQELLAPTAVTFYNQSWRVIGKKDSLTLAPRISRITGIPQRVLKQPEILHRSSVARRMSWAANRQTSRTEDIAYCLLGIFDIHMPLVYGEGFKAFYRLQTQIMDQVEDDSLFAWQERASTRQSALHGLLAKSPAYFASCGNIVMTKTSSKLQSPPTRMTSRGAEVFAELSETDTTTHDGSPIFVYTLGCAAANDNSTYLDVHVGTDVLRQQKLKQCSIAITRKVEREPFCRTDAGKSPSDLMTIYQRIGHVRPEQFYIRTAWSSVTAFQKIYDSGIGRTRSLLRPTRVARIPSRPRPVSSFPSVEPYGPEHLNVVDSNINVDDELPLTPTVTTESTLDDEMPSTPIAATDSAMDDEIPVVPADSVEAELDDLPFIPANLAEANMGDDKRSVNSIATEMALNHSQVPASASTADSDHGEVFQQAIDSAEVSNVTDQMIARRKSRKRKSKKRKKETV